MSRNQLIFKGGKQLSICQHYAAFYLTVMQQTSVPRLAPLIALLIKTENTIKDELLRIKDSSSEEVLQSIVVRYNTLIESISYIRLINYADNFLIYVFSEARKICSPEVYGLFFNEFFRLHAGYLSLAKEYSELDSLTRSLSILKDEFNELFYKMFSQLYEDCIKDIDRYYRDGQLMLDGVCIRHEVAQLKKQLDVNGYTGLADLLKTVTTLKKIKKYLQAKTQGKVVQLPTVSLKAQRYRLCAQGGHAEIVNKTELRKVKI